MSTFPNRRWLVIPSSITGSIDFNQVLEASPESLRFSIDGTKTFIKYEINEVEPILKLVLMQKYDWLKDLKLKNLRILEFGMIFINGLMIVDEEWGSKKWREQYMETSFPGNRGWEDGDYYDYIVNAISEDDAMNQVVLLGVDPDDDIIEVYKGASDMPVRSDLRKQQ